MSDRLMLLKLAQSAIECGDECLLATVVRLDGSGYGRPGARLLMTASGERAGYISGGCLEKDLCRRAWQATVDGPKLIAFDTRGNAVQPGQYNTGCDGVVYVLCSRFQRELALGLSVLRQAIETNKPVKSVLVYRSHSASFRLGDSLAVSDNGTIESRLGASDSADRAWVIDSLTKIVEDSDRTKSVLCNGPDGQPFEAFVEIIEPPSELIVFGAGDDVQPLYELATRLSWKITVVGRRSELASQTRFPLAKVVSGNPETIAATLPIGDRTHVVLMTHDFEQDVCVLPVVLDSPAAHIGILGPKRRLGKLVWQIAQRGRTLSASETERIHAPIGLDIGAVTPEEIAVSIIAELVSRSRHRTGGYLHDRRQMLNAPHLIEDQRDGVRPIQHVIRNSFVSGACDVAVCETRP